MIYLLMEYIKKKVMAMHNIREKLGKIFWVL